MNVSVLLTGTDIQADVHKGFCSIIVEMIVVPMVGKLIIRPQFPQAEAIICPIVKFFVWNVTRRPRRTDAADNRSGRISAR